MKRLILFFLRWQNLPGIIIVSFFLLVAAAAPYLAPPQEPENRSAFQIIKDPRGIIPMPPDSMARAGTIPGAAPHTSIDIFFTLVWGTRSALRFGLTVALITTIFGVLIGAVSGYFGGSINHVLMRITDAFLTFPVVASIVLFRQVIYPSYQPTFLQAALQQLHLDPLMLALIFFTWMPAARVTNSMVMRLKAIEYIEAARALGASPVRVILFHLIPNSISPAVVLAARDIGGVVLLQATFTFIGMAGGSEWGQLLSLGRKWIIGAGGDVLGRWWVFLPATLALILFGIGWNLLGDSLNDWINPRRSSY